MGKGGRVDGEGEGMRRERWEGREEWEGEEEGKGEGGKGRKGRREGREEGRGGREKGRAGAAFLQITIYDYTPADKPARIIDCANHHPCVQ